MPKYHEAIFHDNSQVSEQSFSELWKKDWSEAEVYLVIIKYLGAAEKERKSTKHKAIRRNVANELGYLSNNYLTRKLLHLKELGIVCYRRKRWYLTEKGERLYEALFMENR